MIFFYSVNLTCATRKSDKNDKIKKSFIFLHFKMRVDKKIEVKRMNNCDSELFYYWLQRVLYRTN